MAESMQEDLDHSTELAFNRTWLAEERTLMAWIRTATSMITFGFAIYSFFGIPSGAGHGLTRHVLGPRIFSVALIIMGLVALLLAVLQRRVAMREMKAIDPKLSRFSGGEVIAVLIGCLGLFALAVLMARF
jgi:putative membrane protein